MGADMETVRTCTRSKKLEILEKISTYCALGMITIALFVAYKIYAMNACGYLNTVIYESKGSVLVAKPVYDTAFVQERILLTFLCITASVFAVIPKYCEPEIVESRYMGPERRRLPRYNTPLTLEPNELETESLVIKTRVYH